MRKVASSAQQHHMAWQDTGLETEQDIALEAEQDVAMEAGQDTALETDQETSVRMGEAHGPEAEQMTD